MLGRIAAACALACALAGCPSDAPPACTMIDTSCAPLYEPTFANVYSQTIDRSCGGARSSCHSPGGDGDLVLSTRDQAYAALRGGHVAPGDPACSEMLVRIHDVGTDYAMPPGAPLSDAEQCAIAQWIEAGAQP